MTCTITRSPLIERTIPRETPLTQITFMLDTAEGEDFTGDLPPIALPDDHHDDEDRQCDYSYGECEGKAEYRISWLDCYDLEAHYEQQFCARHYLLYLHYVIDAMDANTNVPDPAEDWDTYKLALRCYLDHVTHLGA